MQIFNAQHIGTEIATARKAKNLTQSALADQLGVSYQAVSNWERSQSLPDIDKYAQLASVLDLDLATLIGSPEGARTVIMINDEDATVDSETLAQAAPVMAPAAVESEAAKVDFDLEKLVAIAPFLGTGTLAARAEAKVGAPDFVPALLKLAPFLGYDELEHLIQVGVPAGAEQLPTLKKLAPFRRDEANDALVQAVLAAGGELKSVSGFLPFMTSAAVDALFTSLAAADPTAKSLTKLAPFTSEPLLAAHVKRLSQQGESKAARRFMPFLSDESLLALLAD